MQHGNLNIILGPPGTGKIKGDRVSININELSKAWISLQNRYK